MKRASWPAWGGDRESHWAVRDLKVREGRLGEHEERDDGGLGVRKQKQAGVAEDTEQKGNGRT